MLSLILCKFLVGATRLVVGAVHPIAGPWLRTCPGTRDAVSAPTVTRGTWHFRHTVILQMYRK
jgi:hypothetical protein